MFPFSIKQIVVILALAVAAVYAAKKGYLGESLK